MTTAVLGALGESSLRALMAAALVAAVLAILRVQSASLRHAAWAGVLLTMLALPWLPRLVPSIAVPVPAPAWQAVVDLPMRREPRPSARGRVDAVPSVSAAQSAPAVPAASAHPAAAAEPGRRVLSWPVLIVTAYLLGVTLLLVRLLIGVHRLRRLNRGSQRVSIEGATVPVYVSGAVSVPLTAGVLRPRVILPIAWSGWPADTLGAVLAHEQAHVRRGDPLVLFLAHLNRCVFWFHPLAWWLERQLARTAEHACDAAAVRTTGSERRYAEVLVELAEAVRSPPRAHCLARGRHRRRRLPRPAYRSDSPRGPSSWCIANPKSPAGRWLHDRDCRGRRVPAAGAATDTPGGRSGGRREYCQPGSAPRPVGSRRTDDGRGG